MVETMYACTATDFLLQTSKLNLNFYRKFIIIGCTEIVGIHLWVHFQDMF